MPAQVAKQKATEERMRRKAEESEKIRKENAEIKVTSNDLALMYF